MIKILIVDDHNLFRMGIKRLLESESDLKIVGDAGSGEMGVQLSKELKPDVVLMDVNMPGMGGIEACRRMLQHDPFMRVIAVTALSQPPFSSRMLQAGAVGYVTKNAELEEMLLAIRNVHKGHRYISATVAQDIVFDKVGEPNSLSAVMESLSEREFQVLSMLVNGYSAFEISEQLCLSPKSVHSYRYRIFDKLKVRNDVELTLFALRSGLLEPQLL